MFLSETLWLSSTPQPPQQQNSFAFEGFLVSFYFDGNCRLGSLCLKNCATTYNFKVYCILNFLNLIFILYFILYAADLQCCVSFRYAESTTYRKTCKWLSRFNYLPLTKGLTCHSDSLAWRNLDGVFAEEGYQENVVLKPWWAIEEEKEYK